MITFPMVHSSRSAPMPLCNSDKLQLIQSLSRPLRSLITSRCCASNRHEAASRPISEAIQAGRLFLTLPQRRRKCGVFRPPARSHRAAQDDHLRPVKLHRSGPLPVLSPESPEFPARQDLRVRAVFDGFDPEMLQCPTVFPDMGSCAHIPGAPFHTLGKP